MGMIMNPETASEKQGFSIYVYATAIIAAVGGFLFGYDTAVIAGAIPFMEKYFMLTAAQLGFAVSSALLGCICGAGVAGSLADQFGRKKVLIAAAFLFLVSAILTTIPKTLVLFTAARFIGGLAIGLSSPISPMYIAEIAPARIRGTLVTFNQLAISFGIVAAYTCDWLIAGAGNEQWQIDYAWRWMFGSSAIPSTLLLIGLCFIPESPRWLLKTGFVERAKAILVKVGGVSHAEKEIAEVEKVLSKEEASIRQLFKPGFRLALFIGIMIMFFSQVTGMNAIYMYTSTLLQSVGFETPSALFGMVLIGAVSFLTTIVANCSVEKIGRRPLLIGAPLGMGLSMLVITIGFNRMPPAVMLIAFAAFVAFFSFGVGPGVWMVTSEIFPTKVRGRAMSIVSFGLWASCFLANLVFPKFLLWSPAKTFGLFTIACFAMIIFVFVFVPETKGKTLEEIENMWER